MITKSAQAQTDARASMGTETPVFNVGDIVELLVFIEHPTGYRTIAPSFETVWGELEVSDVRVASIVPNQTTGETTELRIAVTAWQPGSYETPNLVLKLAAPDGTLSLVEAGSVSLTVESLLSPEDLNLRDIKPQAVVPFPSLRSLYIALGAAAVLAAIGLFIVLRRRRRLAPIGITQVEEEDLRPAHVIALETLADIEKRNLPATGEFREHYTLVSDAIRRYLERGFKIPAMEATTFEIRRSLRKETSLDIVQRTQVERVLQEADLVKFAKAQPDAEAARQLPQVARDFVSVTRSLTIEQPEPEILVDEPAAEAEPV